MKILVTGGLGFIGSHTCVELLDAGYEVVVVDNLYNAKKEVKDKIETITGKKIVVYYEDVCDKNAMHHIFEQHKIDAVIHFAGYKAVGESVRKPIMYYENNLISTLSLCDVMRQHHCKRLVFSSSATVYGISDEIVYTEESTLGPTTNPYGTTKLVNEMILNDLYQSDLKWNIILLRYFNPIGAHSSGLIGEEPNGIPNNLMPYIAKVANNELEQLHVFGNDYNTIDGTGVRDYIHVVDLAKGHLAALHKLFCEQVGMDAYNLGTGKGTSVLELVHTFEKVNGIKIPYVIDARRAGDIDAYYANTEKSLHELHWKAEKTIEDMCRDTWNFIVKSNQ